MSIKPKEIPELGRSDDRQKYVNEKIRWMEENYDLLKYKVDGWCAWPLIRIWIHREVMGIGLREDRTRINYTSQIRFAIKSLLTFLSLPTSKYIIKTYTSARAEKVDNLYKDIYFDDLLRALPNYLKIETINNYAMLERSIKALHPSGLYSPLITIVNILIRNLSFTKIRYLSISRKISEIIFREFKIVVKPALIADYFARFYWETRIYGYILDRVKPEWILTEDPSEFSLLAAAISRNLKTVELAHAMSNRYHAAYSWNEYALKYIARMPLPGKILVFGDYMKSELESWGFWTGRIISVGSLRLDDFRANHSGNGKNGFCTLTWTTQGIRDDQLLNFIKTFLELCKFNSFDVHVNIKLHPVYDPYPDFYHYWLKNYSRQVSVIGAFEDPSTYELISKSHFHISISSTCHYEALGLGVPTIILPFANYRYVIDLVNAGHAFLSQTPNDLLEFISNPDHQTVALNISDRYYKKDALKNILAEIH